MIPLQALGNQAIQYHVVHSMLMELFLSLVAQTLMQGYIQMLIFLNVLCEGIYYVRSSIFCSFKLWMCGSFFSDPDHLIGGDNLWVRDDH